MCKNKIKPNTRGIGMIETIIAIGILVMGVISSLTLMVSSLSYSQVTEQQIVVVNLAREGLEMVRSMRDMETKGFDYLVAGDYTVSIDVDNNDEVDFINSLGAAGTNDINSCSQCILKSYNNRFIHHTSLGTASDFRRLITITDEILNQEKKVVSQVFWTEHGRDHVFSLEVHLTDW